MLSATIPNGQAIIIVIVIIIIIATIIIVIIFYSSDVQPQSTEGPHCTSIWWLHYKKYVFHYILLDHNTYLPWNDQINEAQMQE
jgi:hypothetical protein